MTGSAVQADQATRPVQAVYDREADDPCNSGGRSYVPGLKRGEKPKDTPSMYRKKDRVYLQLRPGHSILFTVVDCTREKHPEEPTKTTWLYKLEDSSKAVYKVDGKDGWVPEARLNFAGSGSASGSTG